MEELTIALSETVTEFSEDLKKLLYKLFNNLTSLTLLKNLDLSEKKEYSNLLKLLNYN